MRTVLIKTWRPADLKKILIYSSSRTLVALGLSLLIHEPFSLCIRIRRRLAVGRGNDLSTGPGYRRDRVG